jgi:hypothetical protein
MGEKLNLYYVFVDEWEIFAKLHHRTAAARAYGVFLRPNMA